MIKQFQSVLPKINYKLNFYKNLTRNPGSKDFVVSDLFPIRKDGDWRTFFELLNINALLEANYKNVNSHTYIAKIIFFDHLGSILGEVSVGKPELARQTLDIRSYLKGNLKDAAVFAVIHKVPSSDSNIGSSLLAERGYIGFEYQSGGARSYVHGNHDALAYKPDQLQLIGNYGIRNKIYYVQHAMSKNCDYEFFFANTSRIKQKILFEISLDGNKWMIYKSVELNPGGSILLSLEKNLAKFLRVKSKLYLARPLVFRKSEYSFDVFHG